MKVFLKAVMFSLLLFVPVQTFAAGEDTELSVKEKKEFMTKTAQEHNIPPELLKAIAYSETAFMQFKNGQPIVAADGGIGIMQITMSDAEYASRGIDKEKLLWDTKYNIEWGAKILKEKWNWAGTHIPKINNHHPHMLEHWYFSVMAYNGVSRRNDPNHSSSTYQDKVYRYIKDHALVDMRSFSFQTGYNAQNSLRFPVMSYQWKDANTRAMSTLKKGEKVITKSGNSNLRNGPDTVGTSVIASVPGYSAVEIVRGPYESQRVENFFSFFEVKVNGRTGYLATTNLQELVIPQVDISLLPRKESVGRLVISRDVPIMTRNGNGETLFRMAKRGEMLRLYGTSGASYYIGGQQYVNFDSSKMNVMIGRLSTQGPTRMYKKTGNKLELFRTIGKGENIRIYNYDDQNYDVGGGYVIPKTERQTRYYLGFTKVKSDTVLYRPDGTPERTLKAGESFRTYEISPDSYDLGGGYYVRKDRVEYLPH
ncbi:transglycosylase SLT domain-containing protein [Bacillus lacus]|uniref:Transglycosylase SLT domain-containing protein n=1 Tax=Metabacillus lacus TaxID=1983721 RepID=A0A7X2LX40_9BACI|nr:transglycosylase SLT domain-containing protein [Metabacillus lacus]MRX72155.1 transglycosylase SLT domain-containing protein [Metabacillus lacus]